MTYQPRAPPAKCKLSVRYASRPPVSLEVLATTLLATVKDLVLSAFSISAPHPSSFVLGLADGTILSVEFLRLQSCDPGIAEKIKEKQVIELRLLEAKAGELGLLAGKSKTVESASNGAASPSQPSASGNASAIPVKHTPTTSSRGIVPSASISPTTTGRPRMASKITKLTAVFGATKSASMANVSSSSTSNGKGITVTTTKHDTAENEPAVTANGAIATPSPAPVSVQPTTSTEAATNVSVRSQKANREYEAIPILVIEHRPSSPPPPTSNSPQDSQQEVVTEVSVDDAVISSLRSGSLSPRSIASSFDNTASTATPTDITDDEDDFPGQVDLSRRSVSLEGDSFDLSHLSPPPSLSRFSVLQLHLGNNRYSNMPVQTNVETAEDIARYDAMIKFFTPKPSKLSLRPNESDSQKENAATSIKEANGPQDSAVPGGSTTQVALEANSEKAKIQASSEAAAAEKSPSMRIASPSLVATTYSPHGAGKYGVAKMNTIRRLLPVCLATTAPIGASVPESVMCFRKTAIAIGNYVVESGMRLLDWVPSPFSVGRALRPTRVFPVVILPAGPQLIKTDLDNPRFCVMCDGHSTPTSAIQAVLKLENNAKNYILRICGTTEYLLDNDRPFVEYARLRLAIRDRRRVELLCELREGDRCSKAISKHFDALSAPPVLPPLIQPFLGLDTIERDTADVNSSMEGPLTFKIHALEHFQFDQIKEHLEYTDASFATAKSQFESLGYCPGIDFGFAVELALIYNNEVVALSSSPTALLTASLVEATPGFPSVAPLPANSLVTSWKPSPMWVEQVRFPFNWSQLPRELRVLVRILFRKSKTTRAVCLGEVCVNLYDSFGILTTGKNAVPIPTTSSFAGKHSYTTSASVSTVYKSKSTPFLHFEVLELKSGLILLHERSPLRGLPKRANVTPIEFLLPEKREEEELSRLLRIHPLYVLNFTEKEYVWKFRYFVHFSAPHSLPLLVKCVNWMNPKLVDELHRLVTQWDLVDPLVAMELLDSSVSDSVVRTFAVDCIRAFSDEELVIYMLQLIQALLFEPFHDSALARFLIERSLRNRTQVGNAFYWHLVSVVGDTNNQERIRMMKEAYLKSAGEEHSGRLALQMRLLHHFRLLSTKASKLDPKAKLTLLEAELQPDLLSVPEFDGSMSPGSPPSSPPQSPPTSPNASRKRGPSAANGGAASQSVNQMNPGSPKLNSSKGGPLRQNALPPPPTVKAPQPDSQTSQPTSANGNSPSSPAIGQTRTESPMRPPAPSRVMPATFSPVPPLPPAVSSPMILTNSPRSNPTVEVTPSTSSEVSEIYRSVTFSFLNLPLDPSVCTRRIVKSKCKFMVSSAAPMWLVFDNADPLSSPAPAIFKSGDDLRQDILILQFLNLMDSIWQRDGLELHVSAYGCVATGKGEGFIEVVPNATTTGKIQKSFGASGAFRKTPLASWLQQQHAEDPARHEEAIENFVSSCAAYCIASYVLGLGDRHGDNIMVTTMGNLFHIDFAHILGNIMMFGAYKRERAPFVLTPEFVFVMGDTKSPRYARFVDLCLKGYNSLRRHTYMFIRLFKMMLSADLPQFTNLSELAYLYKSLSLGMSEATAAEKFARLIDESRKTTTTLVNNFFHNLATGGAVGGSPLPTSTSSRNLSSGLNRSAPPGSTKDVTKNRK